MNRFSEAGPSNTLLTASPPPSHTRNAILEKDGNTSPEVSFPDRIHGYPPVTCGPTKGNVTAQDSCDMRDRLLRYFATCGQEKPLSGSLKIG